MNSFAIGFAVLCAVILLGGWRELRVNNRSDAALMGFIGSAGLLSSVFLGIPSD